MTDFEGVVPALGRALSKRGYDALTPVQQAVLAPELSDADVLVSAQTGSGKTVAFGLAIAPTLLGDADSFERPSAPLALVVAPTRELALQVKRELDWLYEAASTVIVSCVGGMDGRTERRNLERGAHIVVGTPGRLRDHIDRHAFDTSSLRAVVLDEADEMLDLGFREDLEFILDSTPSNRRTLMFSATVPRQIANLAKRYQRDAVRVVTAEEHKQHLDIDYQALMAAPSDQENAIINVLRYFDAKNALVFCGTRAMVNHMTARFNNRGFSVVALSGELSQNERTHALQAMRDGRAKVCIATDVAARGIDLPNLELVVHADLPKNPESLLHRSGRTGRAGRKGVSVLIVPHKARKRTERLLRDANIEASWGNPPSADDIMKRDDERILEDPMLSDPLEENERAFVKDLLARHSVDQVAAAFVRLYRVGQSAPEELLDAPAPERATQQTNNFENGAWISLSVGRGKNAEPGWILAMLCRVGNLSKPDVGSIVIHQHETHVELEPGCIDKFMAAVGPSNVVEKTTTVTRLDNPPTAAPLARPIGKFKRGGDKPYDNKKKFSRGKPGDRAKFGDRDKSTPKRKYSERPARPEIAEDTPPDDKPWAKGPKKPKGKKFDKPKYAGRSERASGDSSREDNSRDSKSRENKSKDWAGKKPKGSKFEKPKGKKFDKPKRDSKPGSKPAKPATKGSGADTGGNAPLKRKKLKLPS